MNNGELLGWWRDNRCCRSRPPLPPSGEGTLPRSPTSRRLDCICLTTTATNFQTSSTGVSTLAARTSASWCTGPKIRSCVACLTLRPCKHTYSQSLVRSIGNHLGQRARSCCLFIRVSNFWANTPGGLSVPVRCHLQNCSSYPAVLPAGCEDKCWIRNCGHLLRTKGNHARPESCVSSN